MRIIPIHPQQANELSALIHQIYPQHFTYLWKDSGVWYLDYSYNPMKLRSELESPKVQYYWAATTAGQSVGYMKINLDKDLPGGHESNGLEIERIYFLQEAAGRGMGTLLIEHVEDLARELGKEYIWLHAMDSSLNSIAFYEKRGFERVGETWLPFEQMKPEYRRMWQMQKRL